jgi:hypothetical protein
MFQRHASRQGLKAAMRTVPFLMTRSRAASHRFRGQRHVIYGVDAISLPIQCAPALLSQRGFL